MSLQEMIDLLHQKHPDDIEKDIWPVLMIYDDGSGRILKNAIHDPFSESNALFNFNSLEQLVDHLRD